jgi:hypothetical protein
MKGFKLSKTGLLILAAGAFVVVLAGLGVMRYGQISEQDELNGALSVSESRMGNMNLEPFEVQKAELTEQLLESQSLLEDAKSRLKQTVISVDVADKFYEIAAYHGIIVDSISTTKNQTGNYEGVVCTLINISAMVSGDLANVIEFVAGLNNNFSTGFVQSVQITISDDGIEQSAEANIMLVVYTYEGS